MRAATINIAVALIFAAPSFAQPAAQQTAELQVGHVKHLHPSCDDLIDAKETCQVLGSGYRWSEGPAWWPSESALLFSDIPRNVINRWTASGGVTTFLKRSGYDQPNPPANQQEPGSNGLAFDSQGRLTVCDHGNRRIYRLETDGSKTTLADRFDGKRFNSPNDLAFHSNGNLYFTDPPYGLADQSSRELDWCGVYRLNPGGHIDLLIRDLDRPNGIGLSPDEKTLYVAQSHDPAAIYTAYPLKPDGTVESGRLLFDATKWIGKDPGSPDGMTIDQHGNLWATGPGGVFIISPEGQLLGRVMTGRATANCTFGADGSTLFMTANDLLLSIKTKTLGKRFVVE